MRFWPKPRVQWATEAPWMDGPAGVHWEWGSEAAARDFAERRGTLLLLSRDRGKTWALAPDRDNGAA